MNNNTIDADGADENFRATAYSGCMDVILAFLPWIVLWNLETKKREKAGIALAMSMGFMYVDFPIHNNRLRLIIIHRYQ